MLSMVLAPFGQIPGGYPSEIGYSYGGGGTYLCPPDPQFNTRGEPGLYFDTQLGAVVKPGWAIRRRLKSFRKKLGLGAIPTDAELATAYQYTPVASAWVAGKEGYFPSPWVPPHGWNPAGAYGPQMSLNGLGAGTVPTTPLPISNVPNTNAAPDPAIAVAAVIAEQNRRIFKLTLISTVIVGTAAAVSAWRTFRQLQRDEIIMNKIAKARR